MYKKYGRILGVCSEFHPNPGMRYRLRIVSTVLLTYCHWIEHWAPPVRDLLIRQFLDFNNITDSFRYICLRFERQHLQRLRFALKIPEFFRFSNGCTIDGEEALIIFLHRIGRPRTLVDVESVFGLELSIISRTFNHVLIYTDDEHRALLTDSFLRWLAATIGTQKPRSVPKKVTY